MLGVFERIIPKFKNFTNTKKLDILLHGYDKENTDMFTTNVFLQITVQKFILETRRFDQ